MKELYTKPSLRVEEYDAVDVITASPGATVVPANPDTPVGDDDD